MAVGWRKDKPVTLELPKLMKKYGIGFSSQGVRRGDQAYLGKFSRR